IKETAHFNNKEFEKEVILLILYDNSKINEFSIDSVFASTDNYRYEIYKQIAYVISSKTLINLSNITTFIVNENYLETIKEILKDAWKISKNNCEKTLKRLLTQKDIIPLIRKIDELKKSGSSKSEEIAKINKAIDAIKLKSMNNKEKNGN
ncbi:MAG: hypothetical protein LBV51_02115, partial [Acholeplasmatales bacterium]|nr:hypothetical protein [Acholeplasmatales bacterium]